ncbi:rhodanese-like domain-containing protein [Microcella sp.]|uniref:rhodanese-like domain-containing protein n=1 Tax=Microcella sp. TaxID=1913979 RepID=UPI0025646E0F|nr:rhodanese-like domain-containing protein [Microcella sp.]MBX9472285.1 sulfurtransferase [Microcella sp.]
MTDSPLGSFADSGATAAHYAAKLAVETDASDVWAARQAGVEFHLVDVRGQAAYDQGHAVGALHIPRQELAARVAELGVGIPVVVYCWSPGCNGGAKAALELARLGVPVKEMLGGFEYWAREGYPVEDVNGPLHREIDPLTNVV